MTQAVANANNLIASLISSSYDGFSHHITIPYSIYKPFVGYRIEFEIELTNCVGQQSESWHLVIITTDNISIQNLDGSTTNALGTGANC